MPKEQGKEKKTSTRHCFLPNVLKKLRIANELTQADVAEKQNVTPAFISTVEKGQYAMSLRMRILLRLAYLLLTGYRVGEIVSDYKTTALDHELGQLWRILRNTGIKLIHPQKLQNSRKIPIFFDGEPLLDTPPCFNPCVIQNQANFIVCLGCLAFAQSIPTSSKSHW